MNKPYSKSLTPTSKSRIGISSYRLYKTRRGAEMLRPYLRHKQKGVPNEPERPTLRPYSPVVLETNAVGHRVPSHAEDCTVEVLQKALRPN